MDLDGIVRKVESEAKRPGEPEQAGAVSEPPAPVTDYLRWSGEQFVYQAYLGILGRPPDAGGYKHFVERLHEGSLRKIDVLAQIALSEEGRARGGPLPPGLMRAYVVERLGRVPVLGPLVRWGGGLLRWRGGRKSVAARAAEPLIELQRQFARLTFAKADRAAVERLEKRLEVLEKRLECEDAHVLDPLYFAFEEKYRGNREDVKEGCRIYLSPIEEARERTLGAPVLDLACGRGEWLELLRERGIPARGVDRNGAMAAHCRERDLDLEQTDALEFLRGQPDASLAAVTSFHYIEHVGFATVVHLLDETLRVLKPGGIGIFETPNARNILVTAGDFYRDFTHRQPIFPDTLETVGRLRGFFPSTCYSFGDNRGALLPLAEREFPDLESYVSISRDMAWIGVRP